ncbi:MAG: hypothetical protein ACRENG_09085, partial [bacterium]
QLKINMLQLRPLLLAFLELKIKQEVVENHAGNPTPLTQNPNSSPHHSRGGRSRAKNFNTVKYIKSLPRSQDFFKFF